MSRPTVWFALVAAVLFASGLYVGTMLRGISTGHSNVNIASETALESDTLLNLRISLAKTQLELNAFRREALAAGRASNNNGQHGNFNNVPQARRIADSKAPVAVQPRQAGRAGPSSTGDSLARHNPFNPMPRPRVEVPDPELERQKSVLRQTEPNMFNPPVETPETELTIPPPKNGAWIHGVELTNKDWLGLGGLHDADLEPSNMAITYEQCMASLNNKELAAQRPSRRKIEEMAWLHFPKCGTSFGAAMYGLLCKPRASPDASAAADGKARHTSNSDACIRCGTAARRAWFYDFDLKPIMPFESLPVCRDMKVTGMFMSHIPLVWPKLMLGEPTSPAKFQFAFFRDPRKRLVSAWNNDRHAFGIPHAAEFRHGVKNIDEYVSNPFIKNCQSKMMAGRFCADNYLLTAHDFEDILRRQQELAFVGLTEAFNMSTCLMYHMFEGEPLEWMFSTHARVGEVISMEFDNTLQRTYWKNLSIYDDPIDYFLFRKAQQLFKKRLAEFKLVKFK